jgi:hypothetical protein
MGNQDGLQGSLPGQQSSPYQPLCRHNTISHPQPGRTSLAIAYHFDGYIAAITRPR